MESKDYPVLKKYAELIIRQNKSSLPPDELINEAILRCHDRGIFYELGAFKKLMLSYLLDETKILNEKSELGKFYKRVIEENICCTKCHEVKPAACFPLRTRSTTGAFYREHICGACNSKKAKAWIASHRDIHLARVRKYQKANPTQSWKHETKQLSDNYIRKLLRQQNIEVTDENIIAKRKSVSAKRQKSTPLQTLS